MKSQIKKFFLPLLLCSLSLPVFSAANPQQISYQGTYGGYMYSDSQLKENIVPFSNIMEKIQKLKGVDFTWKDSGIKDMGVIAQDVEQVFPLLVHTPEEGFKTVNYAGLVAPLIEGVKNVDTRVIALEEKNKELISIIDTQKQELNAIIEAQKQEIRLQDERLQKLEQLLIK